MFRTLLLACGLAMGCKKSPPPAPPAFSDALVHLFSSFDSDDEVLSEAVREVERQVYLGMDVEASSPTDRALEPARLTAGDVDHLEHPGRDVSAALPIAVAGVSPHGLGQHKILQLMADQTPIEPYSPNHYDRTFIEGEDCWADRVCDRLRTQNTLTKENFLMTVEYAFDKDFRWVDVQDDGAGPRWTYVARSHNPASFEGENGKSFIHQSFSIEVWISRDGRGFIRTASDTNVDDGEWTSDSQGSGILRMLSLWSEVSTPPRRRQQLAETDMPR